MTTLLVGVVLALIIVLADTWTIERGLRAELRGRDGRIRQLERELNDMASRHIRDLRGLPHATGSPTSPVDRDIFDPRQRMN